MKSLNTLLITCSALSYLTQASVIRLEVSSQDDVIVDIAPESKFLNGNDNKIHGHAATKHVVAAENDVNLGYEVHRGFLSNDNSYLNFSNIPFAEPPLGDYRFKASVPPTWKDEEVNLGQWDAICPQYQVGWVPKAFDFLNCYAGARADPATCSFNKNWTDVIDAGDYKEFDGSGYDPRSSEDCLLLDVFVPKSVWENRNIKKVPVVAWIHGGGYIYGWKSQAGSPAPLLKAARDQGRDVIYVAMNYRLGAFGWLNGNDFIRNGGTPNVGLHDQNLALSWIQDKIHLFGGDKNSVTVMGQSAGASSILHHITSGAGDAALKPNFSRAILQSPAFFPEGDISYSADQVYSELNIRAGVRRGNLGDLQRTSGSKLQYINAVMTYYSTYGLFKFGPKVDYSYVPALPGQLLLNNTYHKGIRMILGHTSFDGLLFTPPWLRDDDGLREYILDLYPYMSDDDAAKLKDPKFYPVPKVKEGDEFKQITAVSDLLDDVAISCNNHFLSNATNRNDSSTPIWRYLFSALPAIHGSDVFFTYYPTKEVPEFVVPNIARYMQTKFVSFITTGSPNTGNELKWPEYVENKPQVMQFGHLFGKNSFVIPDPMKHERCNFWQSAPYREPEDYYLQKDRVLKTQWEL